MKPLGDGGVGGDCLGRGDWGGVQGGGSGWGDWGGRLSHEMEVFLFSGGGGYS